MYNKKLLLTALKNLNQTKTPVKKKDVEESPLGKLKKGGVKKFSSNLGAKNVLYTKNSLYKKPKKNPLYKKPNYKNKIYDPYGMAFDDGGIIENNPGGPPEEFYKNWFQNRVMPTAEGQKLLEKIRPEALERASQSVPYIYTEELNPNEAGYYDTETQQIILNKFLPEAQIEATKQHEFGHHIQAGDKFYDVLGKPHQYLVEQNIIGPKEISTGNPEWDKNLKKNYDDITNPDEIHARIMTLRNECGFKPDQVITEKDIEDCFKRKKEAGEALDPDIEDLKGVTKGNQSIVNLLNDMVSVPSNREDLQFGKYGLELDLTEDEIQKYVKGGYIVEDISIPSLTRMDDGGTNTCPPDHYWNGEACVPTGRTFTPIDPNYVAQHPDEARFIQNEAEVSVSRPASDIAKFRDEWKRNNPRDQWLDEKKKYYLNTLSNKALDKLAGVNMSNFPADVRQNYLDEYEYLANTYAIEKLGDKRGFNPKRRGEWVDQLSEGEKSAMAESKYSSKVQPSYWARSLAGVQELGNFVLKNNPIAPLIGVKDDVLKYNIPGLTKKEQKEIAESPFGGLESLSFLDMQGAWLANHLNNRGLSTGSDYKELPGILSAEKMANVDDDEAMLYNLITYAGLEALPELGINAVRGLGRGAGSLARGAKQLVTGSEAIPATEGLVKGLEKVPARARPTTEQFKAVIDKNISYIKSPEYKKLRMQNTGETSAQVDKAVNSYVKKINKTKLTSNKDDAFGTYTPGSLFSNPSINIDPYLMTPEKYLATFDHEIKHALSPFSGRGRYSLYKNYPILEGTPVYKEPSLKEVFFGEGKSPKAIDQQAANYHASPQEQQVRALRLKEKMKTDLGISAETPLTEDDVYNWMSNYKYSLPEELGDVDDLLKQIKVGSANAEKTINVMEQPRNMADWMNKAWMLVPGAGVAGAASQMQGQESNEEYSKGGVFKLGDKVDETTMKQLKKLGYKFQLVE